MVEARRVGQVGLHTCPMSVWIVHRGDWRVPVPHPEVREIILVGLFRI